jgi:signal transduction histidine kinase
MHVALQKLWHGETDVHTRQSNAALVFAIGLALATMGLVWFAYVATREWRRGTDLLQQRRSAEALALVHGAIIRDMRGAWLDLIVPISTLDLDAEPPYDFMQQTAQTFAKFPYPESVVIWKGDGPSSSQTYVFNRSDRRPSWDDTDRSNDPFPVVMLNNPPALAPAIALAQQLTRTQRPYAVYDTAIGGVPYQVVAHLMFSQQPPHHLSRFVAITVNLNWVREQYFRPLLYQIGRIGGADDSLTLAVLDENRTILASTSPVKPEAIHIERRFPFVFLDQNMLLSGTTQPRPATSFSVMVSGNASASAQAALTGASRMLALIAVAAIASVIALLQTVRAVRANVRLASMKSDFVSAVTHELKTPVATVRLVGDTLVRGRYPAEALPEYARLLSQEAARLTSSIDHLLTYASYADVNVSRQIERVSIDLIDLVDDALDHFRPTLLEAGFETAVDIARELPRVSVDARAVTQVIEIIVDNAIKYSGDSRLIEMTAAHEGANVRLIVKDHGIGIHPDDVSHVYERFFRGRNARASGSGLGLAIARRIMQHHDGNLRLRSVLGAGTEVDVILRVAS